MYIKYLIRIIIVFINLLILNTVNKAQNFEPIWINYNTDSGLPSSEIYEILQDKNGYIWISTDNGLCKFDGYSFKNYGPINGLKDPVVFHLQEDDNGRIWMNSLTKYIYYLENDSIKPYKFNFLLNNYYDSHNNIENFVHYKHELFYESNRKGIVNISDNGNLRLLNTNQIPSINVFTINQKSLISYEKDQDEQKLPFYDTDNVKYFNLNFYENYLKKYKTTFLVNFNKYKPPTVFDLRNNVKLISINNFLYLFKDYQLISSIPDPEGIFISISQDKNEIIYVCNNYGKGLRIYKNLEHFIQGKYLTYLEGESVSFLVKDNHNGYWAATTNNGIYYAKDLNIIKLIDKNNLNDKITTSSNIGHDNLYLGYQSGKIKSFNLKLNKIVELPFCHASPVFDIYYDSKNGYLYSSYKEGTFCFKNNKWIEIYFNYGKLNSITIKKIWTKNQNNVIYGTFERGFFKINTFNNSISYSSNVTSNGKIPYIRTFCAFTTQDNQLLIGTIRGLYEVKNDSIYKYLENNPSLNLRIEAIDQLDDKTLVVGTKGDGIILIKGNSLSQISEKDGLTSNMIENIFIENNNIWVGTLQGLNKIYKIKSGWKVDQLTIHSGLPSNEIIKVQSNNGIIWCLTNKGLIRIKDRIPELTSLPALISELYINDIKIELSNKLSFTYLENNIRLKLDCLNYKMLGKIPFRFKLRNEDAWRETLERNINLYSLPPGLYDLQIQAKNGDGIWSKSSVLSFSILPPWWKTWQFYLLILFVFLAILGWIIYSRIRTLKRKIEIQNQMNELEQGAKKAQMNPHFLFNTLNSVQSQILTGNLEDATHFLALFGHLVRGVLDMSIQKSISLY
ncbi:MAG TPA: two-component regulator propeller domain-containing protein, partial [Saprospiraceae bacterium]|nr:two-component regulator propeller domain-containing protein [Saprospiraceae bacterium]